ncbi:hypothetical protein IFT37_10345 [Pseudomonas fluorescens]|uniref:hypothetical protein n=1 Tax=Pseudomonas fluorescens group TaxID=136843 RepID=UPI001783041F|nr:hypothetical protein [Pseudomonas fluorescens]MBD8176635.1 hypothetical protein [Pseudomonas fluorescens]MBD8745493.1 hypothetical protein [Pseudomonas fluorescens]MBD8749280.1 hypothetical protein [Pseudomonas fluorescens]MBD8758287.1 hypothetical protein [Pseudomonas fluorescens]
MAKQPITTENGTSQTVPTPASSPQTPAVIELPYPQIKYAADNSVLYPIDAKDGTVATIDVPRMQAAPVILYWAILGQEGPIFEPIEVDGNTSGHVEIPIPSRYVSLCIGHTVLIRYSATVGGRREESLILRLEIQDVREEHLLDSLPLFAHAEWKWNSWHLDMQEFEGDETIRIKAWPMIHKGHRLFACADDNHFDPEKRQFSWVVFDHRVTAAEAHANHVFEFPLLRGWLARRDDYSSLTIHMGVIWDGTEPGLPVSKENPLPQNAQDFHSRTTTSLRVDKALNLPPPHLRESTQYNGEWCLNPENTQEGGEIIIPGLDTYKDDEVRFYVSGPGYAKKLLGDFKVEQDGGMPSVKLPACVVACFFNKQMTLTYTYVFGGREQQSEARLVNVLIPKFATALIDEATHKTLCLNTFSGDATATALIGAYSLCSNYCWMWFVGKYEDGSIYRFDILDKARVTDAWKNDGVAAPIARAALQRLADCSTFELHFAVSFCEADTFQGAHPFPVQTFEIEQEPLRLSAPVVTEAVGSELTVWNGRNGVHVEVNYIGNQPNHRIEANWHRPDGSRWQLESKPGSTTGPVIFSVPREAVIESIGKTVKITCTVTSACKQQTSDDLNLHISVPVRLPTPVVEQATPPATQNGILDLRTFSGDADSTLEPWWFIRVGQNVCARCEGTADANGAPLTFPVVTADPVTDSEVSGGLNKLLKRSDLEKLRDKTDLVITFNVTPDIGGQVSNAIEFPKLHLKFRKAFYDLTDFDPDDKGWNGWTRGAGAADPRDLTLKAGEVPENPNGHYLFDWGYTDTSNPTTQRVKLYKEFTELEAGHVYEFSAFVRDNSSVGNKPRMVIVANGQASAELLPPATWTKVVKQFTAVSGINRLSVDNLQMGISPGNDFDVTLLTVREL